MHWCSDVYLQLSLYGPLFQLVCTLIARGVQKGIESGCLPEERALPKSVISAFRGYEERKMTAKKEKRTIRDGEVVPACAGPVPVKPSTFGDLNDPQEQSVQALQEPPCLQADGGTRDAAQSRTT